MVSLKHDVLDLGCQSMDSVNYPMYAARFITEDQVKLFTKIFMETKFDGGRHTKRVLAISDEL